jgi:hypothetical protein
VSTHSLFYESVESSYSVFVHTEATAINKDHNKGCNEASMRYPILPQVSERGQSSRARTRLAPELLTSGWHNCVSCGKLTDIKVISGGLHPSLSEVELTSCSI